MRGKRPSVKGGKGRYVFIRTNHATQRAANRKQRFRTPIKRPLLLDSNILGCVVANQKAFRNRNNLDILHPTLESLIGHPVYLIVMTMETAFFCSANVASLLQLGLATQDTHSKSFSKNGLKNKLEIEHRRHCKESKMTSQRQSQIATRGEMTQQDQLTRGSFASSLPSELFHWRDNRTIATTLQIRSYVIFRSM